VSEEPTGVWYAVDTPRCRTVRAALPDLGHYAVIAVEEHRLGVMVLLTDGERPPCSVLVGLDAGPDEVHSRVVDGMRRHRRKWDRHPELVARWRRGELAGPAIEFGGWPEWQPIVTAEDLRRHLLGLGAHHDAHHEREDRLAVAIREVVADFARAEANAGAPDGYTPEHFLVALGGKLSARDRERYGL
jgi:hypothetical protein